MLHKLGTALRGEPGIDREVRLVLLAIALVYVAVTIAAVIADTVVAFRQAVVGLAAGSSLVGLVALFIKPSTSVHDRLLKRIQHMLAGVAWATATLAGTAQFAFVHSSSGLYAVVPAAAAFAIGAFFLRRIDQRAPDAGLDRGAERLGSRATSTVDMRRVARRAGRRVERSCRKTYHARPASSPTRRFASSPPPTAACARVWMSLQRASTTVRR